MVKSQINSLKDTFNATGIGFDGQIATAEAVAVDLRANAKEAEQAEQDKLRELDDNYARHKPEENETIGAPGRIATSAAHTKSDDVIQKQKKDKEFNSFLHRLQEQRQLWEKRLAWMEQWYRDEAARKLEEAEALRQKIIDNTQEMIENSNFIRDVGIIVNAIEDGQPYDKEEFMKLLKNKGANVDDNTPLPILLKTAEKMLIEADDENALLDADNDTHEATVEQLELEAKQDIETADAVHEQLENLKAQNLSDEEFDQRANEIWGKVPKTVKEVYENKHEGVMLEKQTTDDYSNKMEQVESFDPFAEQSESPTDKVKQEFTNNPNSSIPSPSGM